jgi:hypothetical protein
MFSCASCFLDNELVAYINAQSTQNGNCNFCHSLNIKVIDTRELSGYFSRFLKAYISSPNEDGEKILSLIERDWKLFPEQSNYKFNLLAEIFKGFDDFEEIVSRNYNNPSSDVGNTAIETWNNFNDEIKKSNRYFLSSKLDLKLLEEILINTCSFVYSIGKIFYRARITESREGLEKGLMGKPPADKTTPGRANPKGIPYLYLSNNEKTTLFETRSYVYDYVTIAEFQLSEKIRVARLQNIDKLSPFLIGEDILGKFLALRPYLIILEKELSRPIRRGDNELDYLPSQYLCEFIKSIGFDGVEYRSSLYEGGFNIALFDDKKVNCINVKTIQVKIRDIEQDIV